jgi:hypothetical protein
MAPALTGAIVRLERQGGRRHANDDVVGNKVKNPRYFFSGCLERLRLTTRHTSAAIQNSLPNPIDETGLVNSSS